MIEKLDYAMVPTGFVHCFNGNCKNATAACGIKSSVYPRYALGGECRESRTYQSYRKVCRLSVRILPCNTLSAWITY